MNFEFNKSGSNKITNVLWSGHVIYSTDHGKEYVDRSASYQAPDYRIIMCRIFPGFRDDYSLNTLVHELAHQYDAPDHYHDLDNNNKCVNKAICSECPNAPRSKVCNMYKKTEHVFCALCKGEITAHLENHHKY